jgi:uncharacterized tellurite resistance protein B-like protein
MNTFTELVGSHALRDTLGVSGIPAPVFRSVARALKVVLASDGAIHPAEMNEYLEVCRRYGATEAMLEELENFEPAGCTVEECFADIDPDSIPVRALLYDAIRIAKADGSFDKKEKETVRRAAEVLEIDDDTLANITALADAEAAVRALRVSMLLPPGLRHYA